MRPFFVTHDIDYGILIMTYATWVVPEIISSVRNKQSKDGTKQDRFSRYIMAGGLYLSVALGFGIAFSGHDSVTLSAQYIFDAGIFLMLSGVALRWYAIRTLGNYFTRTVIIHPNQKVIDGGPYHYIRHPSYTAILITLSGLGLVLTNWWSLILILAGSVIGISYRVRVEEKALRDGIGRPYEEYMKRTKRFIPFFI